MTTLYERSYPMIPWREPIKIIRTDGDWGYACRICVARNGFHAMTVPSLPQDPEEVRRHIEEAHNK